MTTSTSFVAISLTLCTNQTVVPTTNWHSNGHSRMTTTMPSILIKGTILQYDATLEVNINN